MDHILYNETSHNNDDNDSKSISAGLILKTKPKTGSYFLLSREEAAHLTLTTTQAKENCG